MVYRLTDRTFSRLWRRSKDYSERELRWLARKRGLKTAVHKGTLQVLDLKDKVVANFQQVNEPVAESAPDERLKAYAALG